REQPQLALGLGAADAHHRRYLLGLCRALRVLVAVTDIGVNGQVDRLAGCGRSIRAVRRGSHYQAEQSRAKVHRFLKVVTASSIRSTAMISSPPILVFGRLARG